MESLLPGWRIPPLTQTKRKQGERPGTSTSAMIGHTPRRRGSWIPGSLAPGCKLAAWISTDPIANFSQVSRPVPSQPSPESWTPIILGSGTLAATLPTSQRPSDPHNFTGFWNLRLSRPNNFPQALTIPLDSTTKVSPPPPASPSPRGSILFLVQVL